MCTGNLSGVQNLIGSGAKTNNKTGNTPGTSSIKAAIDSPNSLLGNEVEQPVTNVKKRKGIGVDNNAPFASVNNPSIGA